MNMSTQKTSAKVPFVKSFYRSQMSSFAATTADFGVYLLLFKVFHMYYGLASGIGAVAGAVISFFLGRHWAFKKKDGNLSVQALKYILTSGISVVLNTVGMIWMTEQFTISPDISKIVVAILIGVFFNFLMFRYFVYR